VVIDGLNRDSVFLYVASKPASSVLHEFMVGSEVIMEMTEGSGSSGKIVKIKKARGGEVLAKVFLSTSRESRVVPVAHLRLLGKCTLNETDSLTKLLYVLQKRVKVLTQF
jgi:hypothetical protein